MKTNKDSETEEIKNKSITAENEVNKLVENGLKSLEEFLSYSQDQIDYIIQKMALAGHKAQISLAKMAVEETGRGIVEDKVIKNIFSTEYIYNSIKNEKSVGIITDNPEDSFMEIAEPIGIIAGVTPTTNPTSTTMFKSIISIKTRNPIIFAFHPSAQKCSAAAAKILYDAAIEAGAPKNCIQWIEHPSIEGTQYLMNHPNVSLVLATGGSAMVKSAYSTGKPALGVGPGNVPAFIEKSADIKQAVTDIITSKSFDNGMICASEQAAIIEEPIYKEATDYMKQNKCYFTTKEETKKLTPIIMNLEKGMVNPNIVGMHPYKIAELAGIEIPKDTRVLCCEIDGVGDEHPLSKEKLSPVLAVIKAKNVEEGISFCEKMIEIGGLGHTSSIHSNNENVIKEFSNRCKTGRIIVNSPSTHGAIGDLYNTNMPSLTLGCGSYGKNSTTSNVSSVNLINKKRVARRRNNMQWFKIPDKIYFEFGSIQYLEHIKDVNKVFIVTDKSMVQFGYVDKILYHLNKRVNKVSTNVFSQVEPDPSFNTLKKGLEAIKAFEPDLIIALGGGSPIDAAKGMWLLYEQPDVDMQSLSQKFLDIRKRTYKIDRLGSKAKLLAIPTTSGTGSEVTSFAVISDTEKNMKYPFADYALTPNIAIIDPDFVMTVPPSVTADTGLDVLTHAIEAYVSVLASDFTDALAEKAIKNVFKYLPIAFKDPSNREAREKVHNASTMAGMAFTNAFLGINHSLAHKLGAQFHISHGRSNAILLPWVIEYNGVSSPSKVTIFPKYDHYIAHEKYQAIAKMLDLPSSTPEEGVKSLANAIRNLCKEFNVPLTIKDCGIDEKEFLSVVDDLAEKAFDDQCTTANPRYPSISDMADLYKKAYYGK